MRLRSSAELKQVASDSATQGLGLGNRSGISGSQRGKMMTWESSWESVERNMIRRTSNATERIDYFRIRCKKSKTLDLAITDEVCREAEM